MTSQDYIISKQVCISSTTEDLHGETRTKEMLISLQNQLPPIFWLNTEHNLSNVTKSYMTNFNVVQISDSSHWALVGDLHRHKDDNSEESELVNNLSISYTSHIAQNAEHPAFAVLLPFPHYNDDQLCEKILNSGVELSLNRFHKKNAEPETSGFLISLALIPIGLIATSVYKVYLQDSVEDFLRKLKSTSPKEIHYDYSQKIDNQGIEVTLIFLSDHGCWNTSLLADNVMKGTELAQNFLEQSEYAQDRVVVELRMHYNSVLKNYELKAVKFEDGQVSIFSTEIAK